MSIKGCIDVAYSGGFEGMAGEAEKELLGLESRDCIDEENNILELWAKDLLALLEGKEKHGARGGVEMEEVENRIVALLSKENK